MCCDAYCPILKRLQQSARERRASVLGWRDASEKGKGWQSPEDMQGLESRLKAIQKTHVAIINGIEAAQDNMVKIVQGDSHGSGLDREL